MSHLNYVACRFAGRFIKALAIRTPTLHRNRFDLPGPFIVAPTHESHLEPVLLSAMVDRKIDWMARLEFYKHPIAAWALEQVDCFPVNRFGVPVRAIRTAIDRLGRGKTIGIFPEGGCARGAESCTRGGPIKLGACVIALHANVPIVPVVMVNTHCLVNVGPWIPFGRATVWVNFGRPIYPPQGLPRRHARVTMGEELKRAYVELYRELQVEFDLNDERGTTIDEQRHSFIVHRS
jgi:1-acyl-sn-glycerol-3-phosphate acyltransferase